MPSKLPQLGTALQSFAAGLVLMACPAVGEDLGTVPGFGCRKVSCVLGNTAERFVSGLRSDLGVCSRS